MKAFFSFSFVQVVRCSPTHTQQWAFVIVIEALCSILFYIYFVGVGCVCVDAGEQLTGVISLLLCESWELNLGPKAEQAAGSFTC